MAASLTPWSRSARSPPSATWVGGIPAAVRARLRSRFCYAPGSWAQARFEIRSAYVERAEGVYQLNATLDFELPEGARAAVRDGVPLTLHLEIVVQRQRYVLARRNGGDARAALRAGLPRAERTLPGAQPEQRRAGFLRDARRRARLRCASSATCRSSIRRWSGPSARHEISVRASLDVRTMPDALRFMLFWADDWRQRSEWYTWSPQL